MKAKMFEVRDAHTYIPVLAVKMEPTCEADRHLLARSGYGLMPAVQAQYIQLTQVYGGHGRSLCDPYEWGGRTMPTAHKFIIEQFDTLENGAVVDVQFILGEVPAPCRSAREEEEGGFRDDEEETAP